MGVFDNAKMVKINNKEVESIKTNDGGTIYQKPLTLTADKTIIQKTETSTIIATLKDNNTALTSKTLSYEIKHGSTTIASGTKTTNSQGQATIQYTGTGVGDVSVIVSYGSLLQEAFIVQDCHYWNDGSRVSDLEIGSNVSCTSNGSYITITTNTSGEKYVRIPVTVSNNWEFSSEIAELGNYQHITFISETNRYWGVVDDDGAVVNLNDSATRYSHTVAVGDIFKLKYVNGVLTTYINDKQLKTKTVSLSSMKHGFYTNNGRIQKIKNIKVKAL